MEMIEKGRHLIIQIYPRSPLQSIKNILNLCEHVSYNHNIKLSIRDIKKIQRYRIFLIYIYECEMWILTGITRK